MQTKRLFKQLAFYFTIELSNIQGECKPMIGDNKELPSDHQSNLGYENCQTGEWKYEVKSCFLMAQNSYKNLWHSI